MDNNYDPGEHFEKHLEANPGLKDSPGVRERAKVKAEQPPVDAVKAVEPAKAADPKPVEAPVTSIAAKLSAKSSPASEPSSSVSIEHPEDSIVLDKNLSPKATDSFNHIKTIAKGLRDQVQLLSTREAELKSQLEKSKQGIVPTDSDEVVTLRKEHEEMSKRLLVSNLQEHPKFVQEFIAPRDSALAEAQSLLDANEVKDVNVQALLNKPRAEFGKAVSEAAKNLSDFDKTDFAENMRKAYALKQSADNALSKSKEVYGAIRSQSAEKQKQAFESVWAKAAGAVNENIVEADIPETATPEQKDRANQYNTALKNIQNEARRIALESSSETDVASNSIKAAAYDFHMKYAQPAVLADFQRILDLNAALTKQLESIRSRNPNHAIRGQDNGGGPDPAKMSHSEAAAYFSGKRD